ncbi:pyruvate/2-oxoglutarate dehydrogenase complex dihydrolipoamide dehydrogenase (E3) component [Microbacteriaceae bacterium SG_E_30_P1]|uniref:Pyruvate/2-oxoglutarate dehydrogenase complex dihydrolipoamide dehydrogenase (E3) component n=1 Tax=Antiquaquibacter oligotrophicus TaxID=2880260 RepID=A0ABT6KN60_9MICO|nr:NAD(P)/FAD-dependent oxidoreductase [Antiquaquibacter oligotrophicus]MDH6181443.1 pyruvate/2-oxoglutarate dehydrogenase complex dihydrolipoamide dehydrogenase (E3) component [Antiquaquibacter oligotrophicus]UDF12866.1 NAD(P)/FAD-dependent oxidoreductase [Antiquaquibacter oligotrophicus]
MDHFEVVVIGAGPAGTAAALRAAELGASVAVVEASRTGGTCVNTGCVPTRVLAKTARLVREVQTAKAYGILGSGPELDWSATVTRVRATVDRVRGMKNEAERFAAAGIELILEGKARFAAASTLQLDSGRRITADSIIVAVGGHSRLLPIPGAELAVVPEHVLDLPALPQRVAIIGAGNTGAQLTTIFSAFGSQVTLLDLAPRILMPSDPDISRAVADAFTAQGIDVRTGIDTVTSLERADDGTVTITWAEGGAPVAASVDAVVMATGWPADVEDLGLSNAGIEVVRSSIPVDQYFRSSVPHVFAVGDANGRDMLVQAAHFEGEAAAENAVLDANRRTPHHLLPAGGFTDPDYAGVGLTEEQARERDPRCLVATIPFSSVDRAVIDDRETGFLKLITDRRRELILGAHAVGENAVEVVQSVTTAMAAGIDVSTLGGVKFAYPTYSAVIGMAARALLAEPSEP